MATLQARLKFHPVAGMIGNPAVMIVVREQFSGGHWLQQAALLHENKIDAAIPGHSRSMFTDFLRKIFSNELFAVAARY